ncbi:GAF domain-containing sensor histidine kinase [Spirosoma validum]|uniref:histidine kinase n=1 Tax=Spirosoma validum TaxID=2771355 RepID=A0A927B2J0_9BACT|nr:ATP-binding protein [Spirosoma validum]MBD2754156.1 GAF domain-containing protein [Spirosoma validum]
MSYSDLDLTKDIERIKQISIIPTILDVVCQTTGMGFAAVARVTQDRWIACSVRDDIQFGLVPGGELTIESTICNEIRDSHQAVVIDHVQDSEEYCNHHTPKEYGFQSYISFPILLKNGEFFGTLCAIDPKPAQLNNPTVIGMFSLFAELITFHLQQLDLLERSQTELNQLNHQLSNSNDENRQYRHITYHNLQEPLRKLRLFSGMLIQATESSDIDKARELAVKIDTNAKKFSVLIKDLSVYSDLADSDTLVDRLDLNQLIAEVCVQLGPQIEAREATIHVAELPAIQAIPLQLKQLFYQLLHKALKYSRKDVVTVVTISSRELASTESPGPLPTGDHIRYVDIRIADNGIGIEQSQLEKIFDVFAKLPTDKALEGEGIGLAYCRKIVRNHGGLIKAESEVGKGTTLSIILPIARKLNSYTIDKLAGL